MNEYNGSTGLLRWRPVRGYEGRDYELCVAVQDRCRVARYQPCMPLRYPARICGTDLGVWGSLGPYQPVFVSPYRNARRVWYLEILC
eukprot:409436-Rhodomonas_salina.1